MEIYDSEDIKVYMLTKRILFSVMLIVSPSVVASEKAHELYDSIYGGKPAPDVINTLHKMAESGDTVPPEAPALRATSITISV